METLLFLALARLHPEREKTFDVIARERSDRGNLLFVARLPRSLRSLAMTNRLTKISNQRRKINARVLAQSKMQFLHFDSLRNIAGLQHAISTRGDMQNGDGFSSLNLAYHVGDDVVRVTGNRRALANALGYDAEKMVAAQQVHGARVQTVARDDAGYGALSWDNAIIATDALVTREKDIPLMILVADCAPLLLVDECARVLATVHAGWRGALGKIASEAVKTMCEMGAYSENIRAGIGPTLCAKCLEVGSEVAAEARCAMPRCENGVLQNAGEKPHLDLRALLRHDLESVGVSPQNIEAMPHCPRCDNALLFSHRAQNGAAGRFALVAWWE